MFIILTLKGQKRVLYVKRFVEYIKQSFFIYKTPFSVYNKFSAYAITRKANNENTIVTIKVYQNKIYFKDQVTSL